MKTSEGTTNKKNGSSKRCSVFRKLKKKIATIALTISMLVSSTFASYAVGAEVAIGLIGATVPWLSVAAAGLAAFGIVCDYTDDGTINGTPAKKAVDTVKDLSNVLQRTYGSIVAPIAISNVVGELQREGTAVTTQQNTQLKDDYIHAVRLPGGTPPEEPGPGFDPGIATTALIGAGVAGTIAKYISQKGLMKSKSIIPETELYDDIDYTLFHIYDDVSDSTYRYNRNDIDTITGKNHAYNFPTFENVLEAFNPNLKESWDTFNQEKSISSSWDQYYKSAYLYREPSANNELRMHVQWNDNSYRFVKSTNEYSNPNVIVWLSGSLGRAYYNIRLNEDYTYKGYTGGDSYNLWTSKLDKNKPVLYAFSPLTKIRETEIEPTIDTGFRVSPLSKQHFEQFQGDLFTGALGAAGFAKTVLGLNNGGSTIKAPESFGTIDTEPDLIPIDIAPPDGTPEPNTNPTPKTPEEVLDDYGRDDSPYNNPDSAPQIQPADATAWEQVVNTTTNNYYQTVEVVNERDNKDLDGVTEGGILQYFNSFRNIRDLFNHYIPRPIALMCWEFGGILVLFYIVRWLINR